MLWHDNIGNFFMSIGSLTGDGSDGDSSSHISAGISDEAFRAINMPGTIAEDRTCLGAPRVRTSFRFGQTKGPQLLAVCQGIEETLFLFFPAKKVHRTGTHRTMSPHSTPNA